MEESVDGRIVIFSNNSSRNLAQEICKFLGIDHGAAIVSRHNDGEVRVKLEQNVRDADVFIVGSTHPPLENAWEVILLADAARRSSAQRVTLVLPYLGYNRQDRKDEPRVPISGKLLIDALKLSRADRAILLDVHSEATLSSFDPLVVDHLYAAKIVYEHLLALIPKPFVVASVDVGGLTRTKKYAKLLGTSYVVFDKTRKGAGRLEDGSVTIVGDVKNMNVLFVDDMVDTAGSISMDSKAARNAGALRIFACAAHGLLSQNAIEILDNSPLEELIILDTIPQSPEKLKTAKRVKITILSAAYLLAEAIRLTHEGESLSALII
jgi:ribose-phosphate pyrophosphokinase